jgi:ribosomal protein S18 acetylase RimI-like enzyme
MDRQEKAHIVRLVAEVDGQVVANGQLTILRDRGEIGSLVVAAPYRRRGIGAALVRALVEEARQRRVRTLEISASTDAPWIRAWYQRLGFTFKRTHAFPGQEQVAILQMTIVSHDKETQCPPTTA